MIFWYSSRFALATWTSLHRRPPKSSQKRRKQEQEHGENATKEGNRGNYNTILSERQYHCREADATTFPNPQSEPPCRRTPVLHQTGASNSIPHVNANEPSGAGIGYGLCVNALPAPTESDWAPQEWVPGNTTEHQAQHPFTRSSEANTRQTPLQWNTSRVMFLSNPPYPPDCSFFI